MKIKIAEKELDADLWQQVGDFIGDWARANNVYGRFKFTIDDSPFVGERDLMGVYYWETGLRIVPKDYHDYDAD